MQQFVQTWSANISTKISFGSAKHSFIARSVSLQANELLAQSNQLNAQHQSQSHFRPAATWWEKPSQKGLQMDYS